MRVTTIATVVALLLGATSTQAAFNSLNCLAQKRNAAGNFQKCRASEEAKLLLSKPADVAKCSTKFQDKIAKLSEKASKATIECRYADNGDGTVTDYDTGLQWEKKVSPGGGATDPHDVDNQYNWNTTFPGTTPNGTVFTVFLDGLNTCSSAPGFFGSVGFAGHCDWRLPTVDELVTIRLAPFPCGMTHHCIDPTFGPTASDLYWASTTRANDARDAWVVDFDLGGASNDGKSDFSFGRAVRGGL